MLGELLRAICILSNGRSGGQSKHSSRKEEHVTQNGHECATCLRLRTILLGTVRLCGVIGTLKSARLTAV